MISISADRPRPNSGGVGARPLCLRARLARRASDAALLETPAGRLAASGILPGWEVGVARPPSAYLPSSVRAALWISDPRLLLASLLAMDGAVRSLLLISHAQPAETVSALVREALCDVIVTDRPDAVTTDAATLSPQDAMAACEASRDAAAVGPTSWLMTTSGTTGRPKIVPHDLASLSRTVSRMPASGGARWGLLYDPTRFAGMQVVLQALLGGGTLIAPDTAAPLSEQVAFLASRGCTHLSATPTLWRRLLMVPGHAELSLRQATLGGEIVEQPVLDALAAAFPRARLTHIYASTEAGVGFAVNDGRAGFPASYLDVPPSSVAMRVDGQGILWLRPPGPTPGAGVEADAQGFVRSGDRVERRGDRLYFLGRDNGAINVGGVKIFPEVVERVIAAVPGVALVRVSAKSSPITGSLLVADIALAEGADPTHTRAAVAAACRAGLEREAVPARIRLVDDLAANAAGKLVRRG